MTFIIVYNGNSRSHCYTTVVKHKLGYFEIPFFHAPNIDCIVAVIRDQYILIWISILIFHSMQFLMSLVLLSATYEVILYDCNLMSIVSQSERDTLHLLLLHPAPIFISAMYSYMLYRETLKMLWGSVKCGGVQQ